MSSVAPVVLLAILTEALVNTVKPIYDREKRQVNVDVIVAIVFGIAVALLCDIDLFRLVGFDPAVPYAGSVLTGIIISRGAIFVNDLFKFIKPVVK